MFFVIDILLTIASYQFLKNNLIVINHDLFFRGKYKKHLFPRDLIFGMTTTLKKVILNLKRIPGKIGVRIRRHQV